MPVQQNIKEEWPWPEELDAMIVSANHHTILLENEYVRVLNVHIPAGETTAVHTHKWPAVNHILSMADYIRYDGQGNVIADTRNNTSPLKTPVTVWSESLPPHALQNVGERPIHIISIEVKGAGDIGK